MRNQRLKQLDLRGSPIRPQQGPVSKPIRRAYDSGTALSPSITLCPISAEIWESLSHEIPVTHPLSPLYRVPIRVPIFSLAKHLTDGISRAGICFLKSWAYVPSVMFGLE
jgi:hypothetical protein